MTLFFTSHQITIYRNRRVANNRFSMSATFTVYGADIQPASIERQQLVNGRFGATFSAFVDTSVDIKEGDQVHIIGGTFNGKVFSVKGASAWQGAGLLDHVELIMVAQDG